MTDSKHITIHDLPNEERPRERLIEHGSDVLSTTELLAIIMRTGTPHENALDFSRRILKENGGLLGLAKASPEQLMQVKGLGVAKAAQILAALELGRRAYQVSPAERVQIRSADDAAQLVMDMQHLVQEQVRVILLDTSRRVVSIPTVYLGTVNTSVLRISELYREAITRNIPALILVHNHPSGDPSPSPEDIELTQAMAQAGEILDIQFIDHLIIGQQRWLSLREMGIQF